MTFDDGAMVIPLTNQGNAPANAPTGGTVQLGYDIFDVNLYAYGAPLTEHTLAPGQTGYIEAKYRRGGFLQECKKYRITIDASHTMQGLSLPPSVYANDWTIVKTQCRSGGPARSTKRGFSGSTRRP